MRKSAFNVGIPLSNKVIKAMRIYSVVIFHPDINLSLCMQRLSF